MKPKTLSIIGIIFLLFGIYLSVFQKEPHFYTFFSIGLFLIFWPIYNHISKKQLFNKWGAKQYLIFFIGLLIISIIIDKIGLALGYWTYQYTTFFDEVIKYVFEWVVPFLYIFLFFIIGIELFKKAKLNTSLSFALSLFIFVIFIGLFTEYINHFSDSWIILKMPFTSYQIKGFFITFQTIGYWLMAIITFTAYKITDKFI